MTNSFGINHIDLAECVPVAGSIVEEFPFYIVNCRGARTSHAIPETGDFHELLPPCRKKQERRINDSGKNKAINRRY